MKKLILFHALIAFGFFWGNQVLGQGYEDIDITQNSVWLGSTPGIQLTDWFSIHNSGVVNGNGGTVQSNEIQSLTGDLVWKTWIDIGSSAYRAEIDPKFGPWPYYKTWQEFPDGNTWPYQFTVSRPTNFVTSEFKVPGTLQKYGLLEVGWLFMRSFSAVSDKLLTHYM